MVELGIKPTVDPEARIVDSHLGAFTEIGPRTIMIETRLGDYSYVAGDSEIIYTDIGKFSSLASHTRINPGNHPLPRVALNHFTYRSRQYGLGDDDPDFFAWRRSHAVSLGHDCWIGHGAVVLAGVSIGIGAAVGAGAVVTRDVPNFAVAVGNPARVIRTRFSQTVIQALLRIAWWDWPHERLRETLPDFRSLDAETFAAKYDPGT